MKKRATIILYLVLFALILVSCAKVPTWEDQYNLGVRYLSEGNYEEAVIAFTAAIEIDPKNAEAYLSAAEAYIKLDDQEKAFKILRDGYEQTHDSAIKEKLGDEIFQEIAKEYWNQDALHAYGEYVGFDSKYGFGLFDWNYDLTPELVYIYNATDFGTATGRPLEIWTYQDGEVKKLYHGSTAMDAGCITKDGRVFLFCPATHARWHDEALSWEANGEISIQEYLDCYLEWENLDGYELHPEYNYTYEDEKDLRGCFVDHVQVSKEKYEQMQNSLTEDRKEILVHAVIAENCKNYLDYDWNVVSSDSTTASYTVKRISFMSDETVMYTFDSPLQGDYYWSSQKGNWQTGLYAVVREDTDGVVQLFNLTYPDNDYLSGFYYKDNSISSVRAGNCTEFELWCAEGTLYNLVYDARENKIYELEPGYYESAGNYLIRQTITYDVESPRTIQLLTSHGELVQTLVADQSFAGYKVYDNHIYTWGRKAYTMDPICVWEYTIGSESKKLITEIDADEVSDVGDGYVRYIKEWGEPETTMKW